MNFEFSNPSGTEIGMSVPGSICNAQRAGWRASSSDSRRMRGRAKAICEIVRLVHR